MEKIKILQVIGNLHIGGAENVAMNIYRYIDRKLFEFHYLVYSKEAGEYEKEVYALGGKVLHMQAPNENRLIFGANLRKVIRQNGTYNVIHAHLMFHNGIILKVGNQMGIPVRIAHSHSTANTTVSNKYQALLQSLYQTYARKLILKYATSYLACAKEAGCFLYGNIFKTSGLIINNGIDITKFEFNTKVRNEVRKRYGLENVQVYACIAHFCKVKNHFFSLKVFEEIYKLERNSILLLIGEGELKNEIEKEVEELHLQNNVIFTGNISNIAEIMQGIDMVIMPSLYEGLPLSIIECQASGLRSCISDKITNEVDITGLVKFISLDEGEKEWAKIIMQYKNYKRENMTQKVKHAGYDVAECIKRIQNIYLEC